MFIGRENLGFWLTENILGIGKRKCVLKIWVNILQKMDASENETDYKTVNWKVLKKMVAKWGFENKVHVS